MVPGGGPNDDTSLVCIEDTYHMLPRVGGAGAGHDIPADRLCLKGRTVGDSMSSSCYWDWPMHEDNTMHRRSFCNVGGSRICGPVVDCVDCHLRVERDRISVLRRVRERSDSHHFWTCTSGRCHISGPGHGHCRNQAVFFSLASMARIK